MALFLHLKSITKKAVTVISDLDRISEIRKERKKVPEPNKHKNRYHLSFRGHPLFHRLRSTLFRNSLRRYGIRNRRIYYRYLWFTQKLIFWLQFSNLNFESANFELLDAGNRDICDAHWRVMSYISISSLMSSLEDVTIACWRRIWFSDSRLDKFNSSLPITDALEAAVKQTWYWNLKVYEPLDCLLQLQWFYLKFLSLFQA